MKVILTKDVPGLGRSGDVKEVSSGHAMNYLIPKHLALPATTQALTRIQKEEQEKQEKVQRDQAKAAELKKKLEQTTITVTGKTNKQTLFAAIHEKQIAEAINKKLNTQIEPHQIIIPQAIKNLGQHTIEIKLTDTINARAKIEVQAHA